jgi:hypothetical protein
MGLHLFAEGKPLGEGYSPFTAEKHTLVPPAVPEEESKAKTE